MYGTYLRLDITVHANWQAVVRAASRKLARQARHDPAKRAQRKQFYRVMLEHHRNVQELVRTFRL